MIGFEAISKKGFFFFSMRYERYAMSFFYF